MMLLFGQDDVDSNYNSFLEKYPILIGPINIG